MGLRWKIKSVIQGPSDHRLRRGISTLLCRLNARRNQITRSPTQSLVTHTKHHRRCSQIIMKGLAATTTKPSWSCFGFSCSRSSIRARVRRLFERSSRNSDYPQEKRPSYRHMPIHAASGFLETTTTMEMKRMDELASRSALSTTDLLSLD